MDQTFDEPDGATAAGLPDPSVDVDVLSALGAATPDRSMLVLQYGLAVIAAVCALLLSQAS